VSGTVSVLLAKTLTSSTFKQALIAIGTFGMIVSALFSYVYLSTSSYVRSRSDRGIMTEYSSLQGAYERSGRDGLIALLEERIADKSFAGNVYLLVDPSLAILGGNLRHGHRWPRPPADGRSFAQASRWATRQTGHWCGRCFRYFRAAIGCWWEGISAISTVLWINSRPP